VAHDEREPSRGTSGRKLRREKKEEQKERNGITVEIIHLRLLPLLRRLRACGAWQHLIRSGATDRSSFFREALRGLATSTRTEKLLMASAPSACELAGYIPSAVTIFVPSRIPAPENGTTRRDPQRPKLSK